MLRLSGVIVVFLAVILNLGCLKDSEGVYASNHAYEETSIDVKLSAISSIMEDRSRQNLERLEAFMSNISDPFHDSNGASCRIELQTTILSYLQHYSFERFTFSVIESKSLEADIVETDTLLEIKVREISGDTTTVDPQRVYLSRARIRWKKENSVWKIASGLMFRANEIFSDVNARDENGRTALMLAAGNPDTSPELIGRLIAAGGKVNEVDRNGLSAIFYAARSAVRREVVDLLVMADADVNLRDSDGAAAIFHAAFVNRSTEVLTALLDSGAYVLDSDRYGTSVLMKAAAGNSNPEVHIAIIKAGAEINRADKQGATALIKAAACNFNPEVIKALIRAGADLNRADQQGNTALMKACELNQPEVVSVLLNAGAVTRVRNKSGKTALDFAKRNYLLQNKPVFSILQNKTNPGF